MANFTNQWHHLLRLIYSWNMETEVLIVITIISATAFTVGLLLIILGLISTYRKKRIFQMKAFELELKNKELELVNAVVQAQEKERAKIARILHDEVGAVLSMANRNLKSSIERIPETTEYRDELQYTVEILSQSIEKLRMISHQMIPHFLLKFGLIKTLERLMEQTEKALGHACVFETKLVGELTMDEEREINFYSIVLELVHNLVKHARPEHMLLELEIEEEHLILHLRHDGIAITQRDYEYLREKGDGMGLESIHVRLQLISGELQYQRLKKGGVISLAMPYLDKNKSASDEKIDLP